VKLHPSRRGICPLYEDIANIADSPGPFLAGVFFHREKFLQYLVPLGGLPGGSSQLKTPTLWLKTLLLLLQS